MVVKFQFVFSQALFACQCFGAAITEEDLLGVSLLEAFVGVKLVLPELAHGDDLPATNFAFVNRLVMMSIVVQPIFLNSHWTSIANLTSDMSFFTFVMLVCAKFVLGDYLFVTNFAFVNCCIVVFFVVKLVDRGCHWSNIANFTFDGGFFFSNSLIVSLSFLGRTLQRQIFFRCMH